MSKWTDWIECDPKLGRPVELIHDEKIKYKTRDGHTSKDVVSSLIWGEIQRPSNIEIVAYKRRNIKITKRPNPMAEWQEKTGGPAYPETRVTILTEDGERPSYGEIGSLGMTIRDVFAGQIMLGMTANSDLLEAVTSSEVMGDDYAERAATTAYRWADAMLKVRKAK